MQSSFHVWVSTGNRRSCSSRPYIRLTCIHHSPIFFTYKREFNLCNSSYLLVTLYSIHHSQFFSLHLAFQIKFIFGTFYFISCTNAFVTQKYFLPQPGYSCHHNAPKMYTQHLCISLPICPLILHIIAQREFLAPLSEQSEIIKKNAHIETKCFRVAFVASKMGHTQTAASQTTATLLNT